ncbi:protein of unknown function [Methylocella tundrae]|uniref:Uncharacterized protein n=1 Tax=Methylocella tundrae TaxID=227605 RepID=A0A4U8YVI7_METTU|nr:protein of unknown function [Methylocella tundrae]
MLRVSAGCLSWNEILQILIPNRRVEPSAGAPLRHLRQIPRQVASNPERLAHDVLAVVDLLP